MSILKKEPNNKKIQALDGQDNSLNIYIDNMTKKLLENLRGNSVNLNQKILSSLKTIFENIIHNPYLDKFRMINPYQPSVTKIFSSEPCLIYLKELGFIEGANRKELYFPYDSMIASLIVSTELLKKYADTYFIERNINEIQEKLKFPFFMKYATILDKDLLNKGAKNERMLAGVTIEQVQAIYNQFGATKLEDFIGEFGVNPEIFQEIILATAQTTKKGKDFLHTLNELWLETNVIRKLGIFVGQCFADNISRALLTKSDDNYATLARNILEIDMPQAKVFAKLSEGRLVKLEDFIKAYIRWVQLREEIVPGIKGMTFEILVEKGVFSKDRAKKFIENLEYVICERVSCEPRKKRGKIDHQAYANWCKAVPPKLEPSDLSMEMRKRVQDLANEILATESLATNNIADSFQNQQRKPVLDRLRDLIWDPKIWLHQKDLIDDYNAFVVCTSLCKRLDFNFSLDIQKEFSEFIKGGMPEAYLETKDAPIESK